MAQKRKLINKDLESGILGSCFLGETALNLVCTYCKKEDFYHIENRKIFKAVQKLYNKNIPIDYLAVESEVDESVNGSYITSLTDSFVLESNVQYHINQLKQLTQKRLLKNMLQKIVSNITTESDLEDLLLACESQVLQGRLLVDSQKKKKKLSQRVYELVEDVQSGRVQFKWETGMWELDFYSPAEGELMVLSAFPSVGKTTLALFIAELLAKKNKKVLFVSIEMSAEQVQMKRWALGSGVNSAQITSKQGLGVDEWGAIQSIIPDLEKRPLEIRDDISSLEKISMAIKNPSEDYYLVVVDYLQLMALPGKSNETKELGDVCRGLKYLAKSQKLRVLLLSQRNRSNPGVPQLRDHRGSGEIEEAIDVSWMLHKEEIDDRELNVYVRKNRNGPVGRFSLLHNLQTGSYRRKE